MRSIRSPRLCVGVAVAAALVVGPLSLTPAVAHADTGTTIVGKMVRTYADPRRPADARHVTHHEPLSWIEPAKGAAVRVPADQSKKLPVGATVRVSIGAQVSDPATTNVEPARKVLAATVVSPAAQATTLPASAPYTNEVTVVMVHPAGDTTPDPTTADDVVAAVNGPVADFWDSQSRGSIRIHATGVAGWDTTTAGCDQPTQLWDEVAGDVGFTDGPGKHLLLYIPYDIPDSSGCEYGYGEAGTAPGSGGRMYVEDTLTSLIAHEFGHNFGLSDAYAVQCDGSIDGGDTYDEADRCYSFTDWDSYDVMGFSWDELGSLSTPEADLIGLLPSGEKLNLVGTPQTRDVTLTPVSGRNGTRAVRLVYGHNIYWLEYRNATGQDAWLDPVAGDNPFGLQTGVLIHTTAARQVSLMDATPSREADWDSDLQTALTAGRSVWLAAEGLYVTVKSMTSTSAVVRVQAYDAALPRDLDRNNRTDLLAVDSSGVLYRYDGDSMGGFYGRVIMGRGWQARDLITMAGDWNGSGLAQDVIARDGSGNLWLYTGPGRNAGFTSATIIGRGWQGMSGLFSPGDWNGDGNVDLLARRRSDGALLLYPGNGAGGFKAASVIGTGWGSMTAFVPTGDWDLNGTGDFVARRSDGALVLYMGNGRGGFAGTKVIGSGWQIFSSITGVGDWDGDGVPDLLARKTDGSLVLYPGDGFAGFLAPRKIGSGWSSFRMAV